MDILNKRIIILASGLVLLAVVVTLFLVTPLLSSTPKGGSTVVEFVLHTWVEHYRNGVLLSATYHPMTLTIGGKDWIADKLFNSGGTNVTKYAMYIGCSASTDAFNAAWTTLPAEITGNGLDRALASWTDSGIGTGNLTKSFSVSGTESTQLYGLYYETYANSATTTLVAAEQQGAGAVKNCLAGDTLTITIQTTVA